MELALEKKYPLDAKDYQLYEEVGEGVSATVYRALCIPVNEMVAVKVLDLERCNSDLDGIRREVHTMSLINHPNLLEAHCSFTTGHSLWVVTPYMDGGSCLHIIKSNYPEGFEEPVIAILLHQVLKALVYLHAHGHIHRDVKSGNILVNSDGAVKLADFGVSACTFEARDRQRSRNTFVGTPCWMAPEVMQQLHGYDFKADIWSFGITALELAHGHAPFSKYPPMKVLLMTLQNAPPGLDYERDKRFSKSFKELVATCLVKDPKKRPTSEKLLKHPFFKRARAANYLARSILEGLAPLGDRFRMLKAKEATLLGQNKNLYEDKEQLSQQEYIQGISAWNFNLEDLKSQAALIEDYDVMPNAEDGNEPSKHQRMHNDPWFAANRLSSEIVDQTDVVPNKKDAMDNLHDLDGASFDVGEDEDEDDDDDVNTLQKGIQSAPEDQFPTKSSSEGTRSDSEEQLPMKPSSRASGTQTCKGSLQQPDLPSSKKSTVVNGKRRDHEQLKHQSDLYCQKRDSDTVSSVENTSEGVMWRKGRFQATSADLSPKSHINCSYGSVLPNFTSPSLVSGILFPSLQCILQQNITQRDEIIRMIKYTEQTSGKHLEVSESGINELLQMCPASTKERELQSQLIHLRQSSEWLDEELQRLRTKNIQLEKQLSSLVNRIEK